jgi:uncharacterized protein YndB with AHSA1/START domain
MGLFGRSKMSKAAGEWAATAMACLVYADGAANEVEITAARAQIETNPVFKHSIGEKRAAQLFDEAVAAIAQVPAAMLASYQAKLGGLVEKIKGVDDRNFALTTVIAVALGDRTMSEAEAAMLNGFRESLGATIPVPAAGEKAPESYREDAGVKEAPSHVVVIDTQLPVPASHAYQAWTDPAWLPAWWGAGKASEHAFDVRVGGAWRLRMAGEGGADYVCSGTYEALDARQRLVFSWTWESDGTRDDETKVTVFFQPLPDDPTRSRLYLDHRAFASEESRAAHEQGWRDWLAVLDGLLKRR